MQLVETAGGLRHLPPARGSGADRRGGEAGCGEAAAKRGAAGPWAEICHPQEDAPPRPPIKRRGACDASLPRVRVVVDLWTARRMLPRRLLALT
ncbi:hypothetical protein GCM10011534_14390 [Pseudooceanicola nanhaiensis]|uniref:Uncharacterized protein n=1 Tax=Pseudooceanicola nanhaiensis TaxID=375761 RepID=A0A917SQ57_9RHOB|nr:hypothetical protein GCM10011534_14390 [Pseudooceanicola nanhaiensis]